MQCKLLDLLTLTEKAIERRKRYFIENYPLKSLSYDNPSEKSQEMIALEKIREDDTALKIVDKYRHLVQSEKMGIVEESRAKYRFIDLELEDDLSVTSAEFLKDYEYIDRHSPSLFEPEPTLTDMALCDPANEKTKLERTQAWLEDDIEFVPYPDHDMNFDNDISSGDTECSTSLTRYYKKSYKRHKMKNQCIELKCVICKRSHSKFFGKDGKREKKVINNTSGTKILKKISRKKSSYNNIFKDTSNKYMSVDYRHYRVKPRKKEHKSLQPTASKPIPTSLIELCHPELMIEDNMEVYKEHIINFTRDDHIMQFDQSRGGVAATEKSLLIDIVMDDIQETIAMRRTIGTNAEVDSMGFENETLIRSVSNTFINDDHFFDKHDVGIKNDQTIYLNDINEPSTSKGIRHASMDVQCGPEASAATYSILSATTSITRMPNIFTAGVKIGDSSTDTKIKWTDSCIDPIPQKKSTDCCTSTNNAEPSYKTIAPRERAIGIKIKESVSVVTERLECSTMTQKQESIRFQTQESPNHGHELIMIQRQDSSNQRQGSRMIQKQESLRREQNATTLMQSQNERRGQGVPKIQRHDSPGRIQEYIMMQKQGSPSREHKSPLIHRHESTLTQRQESPSRKHKSPLKQRHESPQRRQESTLLQRQESPSREQELTWTQRHESPQARQELTLLHREESPSEQNSTLIQRHRSRQRCQEVTSIQSQASLGREQKSSWTQRHESPQPRQQSTLVQRQESPGREEKSTLMQRRESPQRRQESTIIQIPESPRRDQGSTMILKRESPKQRQHSPKRGQEFTMMQSQGSFRREQKSTMVQKQESPKINIGLIMPEQDAAIREHETTMMQEQESYIMQEQELIMMRKLESHNMLEQESVRTNISSPYNTDFSTETKCLKSIPSGMKIYDSGSEFCGSFASIPKRTPSLANCLNSDLLIIPSITKGVGVARKFNKYVRPKLCYGGFQVHSYRDKQTSEDIMYQGEWQNSRPKVLTKRKIFNPVIVKKITDATLKKKDSSNEKNLVKSSVKRDIKRPKNLSPIRKVEPTTVKASVEKRERINSFVPRCVAKVNRPLQTVSKVPSKLTMSSATTKNTKSPFIVKKPILTVVSTTNDVQNTTKTLTKNYLPYYLRKDALKPLTLKKNLNTSVDSAKTNICMKINAPEPLVRSKTEEIKRDLLKFQNKVPQANYVVLRNEVEMTNNGQSAKTADSGRRRGAPTKRPISPQSQNSSTCSSPNSIATVRAVSIRPKNVTSRRHSTSSHKTSTANSGSENTTPNRNKKFTKRCKSAKMSDEKTFDNKENIPQTSRQSNIASKGSDKIAKGVFLGQQKEVFIAQLKESPPLQSTANKKPISNVNIPKTDSLIEKKSTSPTVSRKSSLKSDDWKALNENTMSESTEISNMVLVLEPQRAQHEYISDFPLDASNIVNSRLITEWMDNSCINVDKNGTSNILAAMRMLVEETLDFIDGPYDNNYSIDSETVVLSREDLDKAAIDLSYSPISFKTMITNENNSLQSDLEQALNRSFDTTLCDESMLSLNDTRLTVTDFDLLSFKSITSVSKYSEYLSAGSSQGKLPVQSICTTSVKDIYERKDQPFIPVPQNNVSAIANQAFSGFSINSEPIAGDKPDPINYIDSETGSMAVDVSRQANSEELFISGRSSDSFESCLIDEDAVVPSWLFQIISQQQAAEDAADPSQPIMIPLPMPDDPMYDVNGNVEGIGLSAGAGDGRGMHSDQSQDSSGRGTSLSSSATSSGAQSEAILIDPTTFVAQFEGGVALLQDSEGSSIVMVGINEEDSELENAQDAAPMPPDSQSFSHGESTRRIMRLQPTTASDADADVSSLETDVPDSSDN